MTERRVFLGWDRPALPRAAKWLLERWPTLDLSGVLVVVPGARVRRLLQAELVEAVRSRPAGTLGALSPPQVVTPGEVGAALWRHPTPPAGDVSRRVAWINALACVPHETLQTLLKFPPGARDLAGRSRIARLLGDWSRETASTGRRLDEVADVGAALADFADAARWRAGGAIQREYERVLDERGLHDADLAFVDALRDPGTARKQAWTIVMVGVSELSPVVRAALEREDDLTSLVQAPAELRDGFDALGCVDQEFWSGADLSAFLGDERVFFADGPEDQAQLALGAIAALGGAFSAEQIVVGVPDREVVPRLQTAGRRVGGAAGERARIEFRPAEGRGLGQTAPATLLRAAGEYARARSFRGLAALVRHPDVERWLIRHAEGEGFGGQAGGAGRESWLGALDAYEAESLPDSVIESADRRGRHAATLRFVREGVSNLLGPLLGDATRPLDAWAGDLLDMLARVYAGRQLLADNTAHGELISACDRLREAALDLPGASGVEASASEAIGLLLDVVGDSTLPAPPERDAIETLGWLELALDAAPVAIVTGFNEGMVPSRPGIEPMLPERLRAALGLSTSESRLARDAYLTRSLLESRDRAVFIAGRRTGDGEPLLPSRLLFMGDPARAAHRLAVFTGLDPGVELPRVRAGARMPARPAQGAMPVVDVPIPDSLPITAFGAYLRSPYQFYLRFVLRARQVEEAQAEMSAPRFGTLIHEVMAAFARTDAAASGDADVVAGALADLVATVARARYGARPRPAVALQIDVVRRRLAELATHQARRAREGWRIEHAEWQVDAGGASLDVDGVAMGIHGKVDRIDRHADGRLAVLDYKTTEKPGTPEQAHVAGRGDRRRWVDLQLPLYRRLAARLESARGGGVVLGYVRIGASEAHIGFAEAAWGDQELASADEAAREVVRAVRSGVFQVEGKVFDDRVVRALCRGMSADGPGVGA